MESVTEVIETMWKSILAIGLAAAGGVLRAAEGPTTPAKPETAAAVMVDSILATVNGDPITLSDVLPESRREEAVAHAVSRGEELEEKIRSIRQRVVDDLIDRKLILLEYERKPFNIPDQYIENLLDSMVMESASGNRKEFERLVRASGMTMAEVRENARKQLILSGMIDYCYYVRVNLTPRELYEYYQAHPAEFNRPEELHLYLLLITARHPDREEALKQVAAAAAAGEADFIGLVARWSNGPNAENGGDLGWIAQDSLRPEFAAALGEAPALQRWYGPVDLGGDVAYLRVEGRHEAKEVPFEQAMVELKRKLEEEARRKAFREYTGKLRSEAIIEYYF